MAHEPKLSAFTIKLKPAIRNIEKTNRNLFRHIIGDTTSENLQDSYIFVEFCRKFIASIDTDEMYSDENTKKSITANQIDIDSDDTNTNIRFHSDSFVIEGRIEGGSYGRKRKKTSTANKNNKSDVSEGDAITDDFYFLMYTPLNSDKSILLGIYILFDTKVIQIKRPTYFMSVFFYCIKISIYLYNILLSCVRNNSLETYTID